MAFEPLKKVYKTPLAVVRGVFLCDNVMVATSVKVFPITQSDWPTTGEWVGNDDWDGDIDVRF